MKLCSSDNPYTTVVTEKKNWNSAVRQKKVISEKNQSFDTGKEGGGSRHSFAR